MDNNQNSRNPFMSVPGAIIIAGVIVAGAIFLTSGSGIVEKIDAEGQDAGQANYSLDKMAPVSNDDHVIGSPDADIALVVYSDLECPFCKYYHINTLKKVMDDYMKTGRVSIVYRHLPLDSIHPKARKEAVATECAAELGGNDVFWRYLDKIYEVTPSNNGLDLAKLPEIAVEMGLDKKKFEECLASTRHDSKIENDFQNAIATGGTGTPWTIVVDKEGKLSSINGMIDYPSMKVRLDSSLSK